MPHHHVALRHRTIHHHHVSVRHRIVRHHHIAVRHAISPHHNIAPTVSGDAPGEQFQSVSIAAPSYTVSTDAQLSAALRHAQAGQTIQLASGATFSKLTDTKARSGWVTISGAGDAETPVIEGAMLAGARYLRFDDVEFDRAFYVESSPTLKYGQPAENIQLLNSEVDCGSTTTASGGTGIMVRGGSQDVTISGDYVHDCVVGFGSIAQDDQSSGITITHDLFQDLYGDAIDLGGLQNVTINDDVIQDIARTHGPAGRGYHDDAIQFFGNDTNVAITNNVIDNCLDQLIFIQDAVKGTNTGSSENSNVLVQNNLLYGNTAFAVQDQGGVNVSFIDNTIWDNGDGSLLVTQSGYTGIVPNDTTIEGNVIESYFTSHAHPAVEQDNIIGQDHSFWAPGAGDITDATPQFTDPTAGNFSIVPNSLPAPATTPGAGASAGLGAYGDTLPVPSSGFGAPRWGV